MHVQNWRIFPGDGRELWECCQPWLQCYFSFSSSSFFMSSALTPFPAQQTFQIISNLPTQDRRLRATLCAAGFFIFLALVAYPKFFAVFATDQGKRTQMCHGEYRLSICVYRCLGLRVLIYAQCTCTGSTTL